MVIFTFLFWLVQWVPFIHTTDVAQKLNQMGADFSDCTGEIFLLWGLFGGYFLGVVILYQIRRRRSPQPERQETAPQ